MSDRHPVNRLNDLKRAMDRLEDARDLCRSAGAPKTLSRVRLAISSLDGAIRNAECRVARTRNTPHLAVDSAAESVRGSTQ